MKATNKQVSYFVMALAAVIAATPEDEDGKPVEHDENEAVGIRTKAIELATAAGESAEFTAPMAGMILEYNFSLVDEEAIKKEKEALKAEMLEAGMPEGLASLLIE